MPIVRVLFGRSHITPCSRSIPHESLTAVRIKRMHPEADCNDFAEALEDGSDIFIRDFMVEPTDPHAGATPCFDICSDINHCQREDGEERG